jgi:autotransporter-associated beta strand protein
MKPTFAFRSFLALTGSLFLAAQMAQAVPLYWDIDGATAGSGGATPSGTWSTGGSTWSTDSTGTTATSAVTTTAFDDLFFSAGTDATGAYAIDLNTSTQNARLVTFEDGTATLSTGTLSLGNLGGITVTTGTVTGATISSNLTLSGRQTFNVAAGRALTLDTGSFTRNAGATLNILSTGTVTSTMTGLSTNDATGIIGNWASYNSGANTTYAKFSGSTITGLGYTGGADGVDAGATSTNVVTGAGNLNYTLSGAGTLGASANINTLRYTGASGTLTTSTSFTTNGIMNTGGGTLTFSGSVTSGTGEMVIHAANGGISLRGLNNNGNLVTVTGSGDVTMGAGTYSGSGGYTMNGSGTLNFQPGTVSYTGTTTINSGTILYNGNYGSGNITLNGGSLRLYFGSDMTRALGSGTNRIQIIGGDSGFDGNNGICDINFGNAGAEVQWGSTFFNPTSLRFQDRATATNGADRTFFKNALDLNGATRTIAVNAALVSGYTQMDGVIRNNAVGAAGLVKMGIGELRLNAANTYNGGTTISNGVLTINSTGTLGQDINTNNVSLAAGARLNLSAAGNTGANQTITLTSTSGSLSTLALGYNGVPNATIAQADTNGGVIAINAVTGYTGNLSTALTGKNLFLGGIGTSTFTGAVGTVVAGNGSTYRLGGGGGSISFNTANLITGANAVQIGSTATNGTGTVVFGASQDFTLGATVNSGSGLTLGVSQGFSGGVAVNSGGILTINTTQAFAGGVTLASGGQIFVNPGINGTAFGAGNLTIGGGRIDIAPSSGTAGGSATTSNNNNWNASWTIGRGSTGTATWNNNGNILLGNNITVSSANNNTFLNLGGIIDDGASSFGLTFGVNGTTLSNANTYNGATAVTAGALTLANVNAIQNSSGLNMSSGTTLNLRSDTAAIFATPLTTLSTTGTANMTLDVNRVSSGSGNQLTLNGGLFVSNAHGNVTTLNFTGGNGYTLSIPTLRLEASGSGGGGGGLTLNPTNTSVTIGAMNIPANNKVQLLTLDGTSTANSLGAITQTSFTNAVNFIKTGTGTWKLTGSNNYRGTTTIQAGTLLMGADAPSGSSGALGNASTAVVLGNGSTAATNAPSLLIDGAFTVARAITVGSVANTAAYNATIGGSNTTGTSIFSGNITLNTTATNYTATLRAATGGTTQFSTGTWTTNNKAIAIGSSGNAGTVRINNAISTSGGINVNFGTLELNSAFTSGNMALASGTTLSGTGSVAGTTGVTSATVNGTGLTLTGLTTFNSSGNTLSGTVTSTNGVTLASSAALAINGALTGNATVGNGALSGTGSVSGTTGVTGGTITGGTGFTLTGLTTFNGAGNTLSGTVTSTAGVNLAGAAELANSATVTGGIAVGAGTLTGAGGSFSAASTVNGGVINLASGSFGSTLGVTGGAWNGAGSVTGLVTSSSGTFTIGTGANLTAAGNLDVTGGTLAAGDSTSTITGSLNYSSSSNSTYAGVIAGSGKTLTMNSASTTLTLTGDNSYTGATNVDAGTLLVNGSTAAGGAVSVASGAILGGTGTIGGAVNVTGQLSPGASIESLVTGALTMESGSTFIYEVADASATGADMLGVNGALSLDSVTLYFDLATAAALENASLWTAGDKLTLISYTGTGITSGFNGYADNTTYNFGSNVWEFDYNDTQAGANFDSDHLGSSHVTLTAITIIPEPSSALLVGLSSLLLFRRRR